MLDQDVAQGDTYVRTAEQRRAAVAIRLGLPVVTADRLWRKASLQGVDVEVLRR
ncbi:MAG: hypothetical protein M3345_03990 [Actinomycetota bacterium]|nr:hypothetical protein [Actinomycetota bacterium]